MPVHDPAFDEEREAQQAFRVVLEAMAWPGRPGVLPPSRVAPPPPWPPSAAQVARTLLDAQVRFAVCGDGSEPLTRYLAVNTGAQPVLPEAADYVVAGPPLTALDPMALSPGTALDPDRGATLLLACERIRASDGAASRPEAGPGLILRGRGIAGRRLLWLAEPEADCLRRLAARRDEYPLGIDVVLVDATGRVVALPRTTSWGEAPSWAM